MAIKEHKIILKGGHFYVKTEDEFTIKWNEGNGDPNLVMLIHRYDDGDVDVVGPKLRGYKEKLIGALYDLYQTDDTFDDGDVFTYRGKVVAICKGVHVVPSEGYVE